MLLDDGRAEFHTAFRSLRAFGKAGAIVGEAHRATRIRVFDFMENAIQLIWVFLDRHTPRSQWLRCWRGHECRTRRRILTVGDDLVVIGHGDIGHQVRALTSLGFKEAKDLVDSAPKPVLERVNKEAADKAKEQLEAAGATIEIK